MQTFRNAMVWLHRWIALIFSIAIIIVSVTGSIIVIDGPIDRALNPVLYDVVVPAGGPVRLPLDSLLASARTLGSIGVFKLPEADGYPVIASVIRGGEVFVNPYTGQVLGTRTAAQRTASFANMSHLIHVTLLGKAVGNQIVVWSTIASLFLVLGGLYLWWKDKIWRIRPAASWKRINLEFHHLLGITTAVVAILMLGTGVIMHYAIARRVIARLDGDRPPGQRPTPQSPAVLGTPMTNLEAAAAAARLALPGSEVRSMSLPADTTKPISFGMRLPEESNPDGASRVFVDRWTGAVLSVRSSRDEGLGTRINRLQRPLHTGDIYGTPTQVIWFFGSLVLVVQAVTGVVMWWNGRPARKAAAARTRPSVRQSVLGKEPRQVLEHRRPAR